MKARHRQEHVHSIGSIEDITGIVHILKKAVLIAGTIMRY
jgi:hypothetical protein